MARADPIPTTPPKPDPAAFVETGVKRVEDAMRMQSELSGVLQEFNSEWFGRARSKMELYFELMARLAAARSVPDAIAASQDWISQRMEMFADGGQRLVSDCQKIMEASTRLVSNSSTDASTDDQVQNLRKILR